MLLKHGLTETVFRSAAVMACSFPACTTRPWRTSSSGCQTGRDYLSHIKRTCRFAPSTTTIILDHLPCRPSPPGRLCLQVLRYSPGQRYKQHMDGYDRIATLLIYLTGTTRARLLHPLLCYSSHTPHRLQTTQPAWPAGCPVAMIDETRATRTHHSTPGNQWRVTATGRPGVVDF